VHYGAREIEARASEAAPGLAPASTVVELEAPLWSRFPFDILLEVFVPIHREDRRVVRLHLEPARPPASQEEIEAAIGRAKQLRGWAPDRPIPPGRSP